MFIASGSANPGGKPRGKDKWSKRAYDLMGWVIDIQHKHRKWRHSNNIVGQRTHSAGCEYVVNQRVWWLECASKLIAIARWW